MTALRTERVEFRGRLVADHYPERHAHAQTVTAYTAATEAYLGDGVYASYDGFMIRLRTPRGDGDHEIYFDPAVLAAFERFVARLSREEAR